MILSIVIIINTLARGIVLYQYPRPEKPRDIFITKNGKIIAKLTNPYQDKVSTAQSLFGILPQDADIKISKEERLAAK